MPSTFPDYVIDRIRALLHERRDAAVARDLDRYCNAGDKIVWIAGEWGDDVLRIWRHILQETDG